MSNKNYTVDIIIPFYEYHYGLNKLLKSLNKLNLKKIDLKILIIIDGSKINTKKLKKKYKYKISFIAILSIFCLIFIYAQEVTLSLDGQNLNYVSTSDIAGFQFNVDDVPVNSAFGGEADANGFFISTNGTMVLGFSLRGATIPAGQGTLLLLDLAEVIEGELVELNNLTFDF